MTKYDLLLEIKKKGIYPVTKDTPEQEKQTIRELLAYECIIAQTVSSYRLGKNGYECINAGSWEDWIERQNQSPQEPTKLIEKGWFQLLLVVLGVVLTAFLNYLFS